MSAFYAVGYSVAKQLYPLAQSENERAAVDRLCRFRGDAADMQLAARMFEDAGEGANVQELLRQLEGASTSSAPSSDQEARP